METKYTRRDFVALTALAAAGVTLAGCQAEAIDKAAEANMAIEHRICEELSKGNAGVLDQTCTANWVCHHPLGGNINLEQFKAGFAGVLAGLPDFKVVPDGMFAAGDKVALRITCSGTHKGVLMGAQPTGKQLSYTTMIIDRFSEGKIAEEWQETNWLGLYQQLGLFPCQK